MRPTIADAEVLALVCAALTFALIGVTFVHASARAISARRLRPRIIAANHTVTEAIGGADPQPAIRALSALPRRTRVEVLISFTGRVSGAGTEVVAILAVATGLAELGRRWRGGRRAWRRVHGARLGLDLGAPTDDLPRLLADRDAHVSAAAADWAGRVGDVAQVDALIDLMGDRSPLRSFAAMNAVVRLGRHAVPALEARLEDTDARVLDRYLDVAAIIRDPAFLTAALALAVHPSAAVRAGVATLLGNVGDATAIDPLHRLTMASEPEVRAAAAFALGRLQSWESAPALGLLLRDQAWVVRRAAMFALLEIGNPGRLVLRGALNDEDRFVRDIASLALGLRPRPAAAP